MDTRFWACDIPNVAHSIVPLDLRPPSYFKKINNGLVSRLLYPFSFFVRSLWSRWWPILWSLLSITQMMLLTGGELLYGLSNIRIFHFAGDDSVVR